MPLIVTGSIGIDTIETPGHDAQEVLGGSSIYFAAAASFFGGVRLVGAVGEDFPEHYVEHFHHFDVDTAGLERRAGSQTFRWHGRYHDNMNDRDTVSVDLNVLIEALPPVPESYRDSRYVFLAVTSPANQLALLDEFPERRLVVADTIDLYINNNRDELDEVMRRVDGIIFNDSEAELLTGEPNAVVAADRLLEMGPSFVIVKKGAHGAILRHQGGTVALPAYPSRQVVDPTGAGDSFAGGFMGFLANTSGEASDFHALKTAMAYGTMVASFTIEAFGPERLRTLKRDEINARYREFATMMDLNG